MEATTAELRALREHIKDNYKLFVERMPNREALARCGSQSDLLPE